MEPLLRSLHRDDSTGHTRQIKPGEHVESIWDAVTDERSIVKMIDVAGPHIIVHDDDDVEESLYMFYNEPNEAEDAFLFPDESTRKNFAFREISNGAADFETLFLPSQARYLTKDTILGIDPQHDALRDQQMHTIWCLPNLWVTGSAQVRKEKLDGKSRALLKKTGLMREPKNMNFDIRMETLETQEIWE